MKVVVIAVLASLSASSLAVAEPPGLTSPTPPGLTPPTPSGEPTEVRTFSHKSETLATGLTVAGIMLPMALFGAALADIENDDGGATVMTGFLTVGGPAIGHWYSNHVGTYGMIARLVAMGFVGSGYSEYAQVQYCRRGQSAPVYCEDANVGDARLKATLGFGIYGASWIYDLVTSRREVRRYNAARTYAVVPTIAVTANSAGAGLVGTF